LPHLAQEHEAVRAVQAALAIHEELSKMAVRTSIGIASGRAFCGAYGSSRRRQYTIVGPVINLASRLTQPAAGGILCDETTQRRANERIRFEALPPITIKGRNEPLVAFKPAARIEQETTADAIVFVGRDAERSLLRRHIDRLKEGKGGVVGLVGEAGIGKSYLMRDAVTHARASHVRVLSGAGDAMERATTYYVWRSLLMNLLSAHREPSVAEMRAALLQRLSDDEILLSWAPLLNAIVPLNLEDNDITRYMESEARTDSIQAIMTRLLELSTRKQPTMLVVDDLHWVDSGSLGVITAVAARVPGLLILFGTRPPDESSNAQLQRITAQREAEIINLESLTTSDVAALISARLGVTTVPDAVTRFIEERGEGHPFYTDELIQELREAGLIEISNGECRIVAEDLNQAEFPDSVQAVVNSRIDRLAPVEQLTLKTASVIGRVFPFSVLADVYPVEQDRPTLRGALAGLERADLAHPEEPEPNLSYLFRHVITQDVAYNSLLFSQRRQLHERVAKWYEHRYDGALSGFYPLLAHHYDRAEIANKALEYLEKAGIDAMNAFSSEECAQFFHRVIALAEQYPQLADIHRRAEWQRYLGDAYQHMTDYKRSQVHLNEALRLIGRTVPKSRAGLALQFLKEVGTQIMHRLMPRRFVGTARGDRQRDLTNAAVAYRGLTEMSFFEGDNFGMMYNALCCLNCGERARQHTAMSTGAGAMAVIFAVLNVQKLRDYYIRLGVEYAKSGLSLTDIAYADGIQTTLVEIAAGRWQEAEAASQRGLAGFARVGYRVRWEALRAGYSFMLQLTGRFHEAMQGFDEVYASARGSRMQNMLFARNGQIGTALPCGYVRDEWVSELESLMRESPPMTEATTGYGLVAQMHLRRGDVDAAWIALETGLDLVRRHPPNTYYGLAGFANIAATYLEIWANGQSPVAESEIDQRAAQACTLLRQYSRFQRVGRPRSARCDGLYQEMKGNTAKALQLFRKGLTSAQAQQLPYDEALLHYELARMLPASDPKRAQHLEKCLAMFDQLDASYDLERARSLHTLQTRTPVPA
jgi:tetratricopeptide (TPR) repeat protein